MDEIGERAQGTRRRSALRAADVRITDVAQLAGVSTATVSRALADPDRVSPATRARVADAVQRLGYVPHPAARSLRSRKTRMVLVVVPDLENVFFSKILRGIEETLASAGYGTIIADLPPLSARRATIARFARRQVDGVILLNGHRLGPEADGLPTVGLCEAMPDTSVPQVVIDNRAAARRIVSHLVALGHRRIARLTGPAGNVLEVEREAGWAEALAEAGLPRDDALVWPGDYTIESGARAAGRLLAADRRPSAVFCSNDVMAIGLIGALGEAGLDVPRDVSVAGFDDIEFAAMSRPALTTIRQPRRALGRAAAEALLARLAGETPEPVRVMATELVVRDSTAPAPPAPL